MRFKKLLVTFMLAVSILTTLLLPSIFAGPIFTGDVPADFTAADVAIVTDPGGIGDVGIPASAPPGTVSGWDVSAVYFDYDHDTDTMYVGYDCGGSANPTIICGDADGDGDPGGTSAWLAALGGVDRPDLSGTEVIVLLLDGDMGAVDGPNVVVGTHEGRDITQFLAYERNPAFGYAAPGTFAATIGTLPNGVNLTSPSAVNPDLEFSIDNFSTLPGYSFTPGQAFTFHMYAVTSGGIDDLGIGEDSIPNAPPGIVYIPGAATIGDYVWDDDGSGGGTANDGIQDPGEPGHPNVTVHLYDVSNTIIATTTTNATGYYSFTLLDIGVYSIGFIPPTGYTFSPQDTGANDAVDSDADPATGRTITTTLTDSEVDMTWDAGLVLARDWGDAPDPNYPTLNANNGARHIISSSLYLGADIDSEADGQQSANADGDDTFDGNDDEDGVTFTGPLMPGTTASIDVVASAACTLSAWIDFNGDGDWSTAGDDIFPGGTALTAGTNTLPVVVPFTATPGTTYARFRCTTDGAVSFTGEATDGEVEDYQVTIVNPEDWGDNPDTYGTTAGATGPNHVISGPFMGSCVDVEVDGFPSVGADGDDTNVSSSTGTCVGGDDEDGVTFTTLLTPGDTNAGVDVDLSNSGTCTLNAWIDFNGDGDFLDANEQIAVDTALTGGVNNSLTFSVPAGAVIGATYSRFRCSTDTGLAPTGPASDGEVEDYQVQILAQDWGDNPDTGAGTGTGNYETLNSDNGPRHVITGPYLGACVDAEVDGQQSLNADGDDTGASSTTVGTCAVGNDDEDGVNIPAPLIINTTNTDITVNVNAAGACTLNAWIDFNADGDFLDTDEQIATDQALAAGSSTGLSFPVPAGAVAGTTYARFRCSTDTGLAPTGSASDGEVEDYQVVIEQAIDWGDNPDSYSTLSASSGPNHIISGPFMGACVDSEADGIPSVGADGDDTDIGTPTGTCVGDDDEDGVTFVTTLTPGANADVDVDLSNSATCTLDAWVDFNGDGDFLDAGEQIFTNQALTGGVNNALTFAVPAGATPGNTYSRFRCSTDTGLTPTGPATDGEVEDHPVVIGQAIDWGDNPDSYSTLSASSGPNHIISGPFMGACVDAEADGLPTLGADGDDTDVGTPTGTCIGNDDEDGVTFTTALTPGANANVDVDLSNSTACTLDAWVDFNIDGDFLDAGEQIATDMALTAGINNTISFAVPAGANAGSTFSRFRCSTDTGLAPTGPATDGEVEDHPVTIGQAIDWGDNPDSYGTLSASTGPNHVISGPFMGACVDAEADGMPSAGADGDDTNVGTPTGTCVGNDDEDGVTFTTALTPGDTNAGVDVDLSNSTACTLNAWIDFNIDGDFADAGEQIATDAALTGGTNNSLIFTVPAVATSGATYSRFRCSTDTGLSPTGAATDGEVEDHPVTIGAALAAIGDYVWADTNQNGIQDAGEVGVNGVTVELFDSSGVSQGTTTTANNGVIDGYYEFINLTPGDYYVVFTLPAGYTFSPQDQGADDALDSDADTTTGQAATTTLDPGENDTTWDAGIYAIAALGDYVWLDTNNDGIQDAGETPIPGVTVNLWDGADTGILNTTTTDASGNYLFSNLTPADYLVEFILPTNFTFSPQDQGADDSVDSDPDPATGKTIATTLTAGETDLTWDAGMTTTVDLASVGDYIWLDTDGDGIQDVGEPGVAGVTVNIWVDTNNDGIPDTILSTTTTDATGFYEFINLIPDVAYQIEFVLPTGYVFALADQGADDTVDSDADPTTGLTPIVVPAPGENIPTLDAGVYQPAIVVHKAVSLATIVPNQQVTYTLTITNVGTVELNPVQVIDTMDVGLTFIAGSATPAESSVVGQVITWDDVMFGAGLAPGASTQITFLAEATTTPGTYNNVVVANGTHPSGIVTDTDNASVIVSDPTVDLNKGVVAPGIDANGLVTFTIRITNTGPSTINQVPLFDQFFGPIQYVGGSPAADLVDNTAQTLGWTDLTNSLGNLAPGQVFVVTTRFQVDLTQSPYITNTATVNGASDTLANIIPTVADTTDVDLLYFWGKQQGVDVLLEWVTAIEIDNYGFRVLRNTTNNLTTATEINFVAGQGHGTSEGASYSYIDTDVVPNQTYTYWLVDVDYNGVETVHGPVNITVSEPKTVYLPFILK